MASVETLRNRIMFDPKSALPLHGQLRDSLRRLIEEEFEDGEQFFTETGLIAELGLSQATVRRALSDLASEGVLERRVAKGTFVRKKASAEQLVGIFLPGCSSAHHAMQLEALTQACFARGARLRLYHTDKSQATVRAYGELDFEPHEGGAVLFCNSTACTAELCLGLESRGYRVVVLDSVRPAASRAALVGMDSRAAMQQVLGLFQELGHRHVALLGNEPANHGSMQARAGAFEDVCTELALEGVIWWAQEFGCPMDSFEMGRLSLPIGLERNPQVTAVITGSDSGAFGVLQACAELGISVPGQLSVIGINGEHFCKMTIPPLTSVRQPYEEMAEKAVELALTGAGGEHVFAPTLEKRSSCGLVTKETNL